MKLVSIVYNTVFIPIGLIIIKILKTVNKKLWLREADWKKSLENLDNIDYDNPRIWFHSASMGEFEQAKPVIEEIKKRNKSLQIIVSFFSPSGYVNQKKYEYADAAVYLPFDTKKNVRNFLSRVKPQVVIFIRYEIWRNYLEELHNNGIPAFLICATVPASRALRTFPFFKSFAKSSYSFFERVFTIGEQHSRFFERLIGADKVETMSDTRFDRIVQNVGVAAKCPLLPAGIFNKDEFILVAGSTWLPDENIIIDAVLKFYKENKFKIKLILVPHEPDDDNLKRLKNRLPNSIYLSNLLDMLDKYSADEVKEATAGKVIIVDSIGSLLKLYSIADAAYIGGAFGAGVHSVAEPAGYGIPLAAGSKINNSPDALNLQEKGALTVINGKTEFYKWMEIILSEKKVRDEAGKRAKDYVYDLTGSSKKVADVVLRYF